jgi:hypothetical protein
MSRELMKLALEELQNARDHIYLLPENEQPLTEEQILNRINAAITVLHQEVYGDANDKSQKCAGQQEPVAWMHTTGTGHVYFRKKPQDKVFNPQPVYTVPPTREWVGLTLNEAEDFYDKYPDRAELINAVDRFLEEKNHG